VVDGEIMPITLRDLHLMPVRLILCEGEYCNLMLVVVDAAEPFGQNHDVRKRLKPAQTKR
jgi:hypothetical protein